MATLLTVVEWSTVIVTFVMMASGLPGCFKMYKQRNTSNVPYMLFLILSIVSALSLQYALMIQNNVLVVINLVSVLVWGFYSAVYVIVSQSKMSVVMKMFGVVSLYSAHVYYLRVIPTKAVLATLGNYLIVWSTLAYVLPVGDIMKMIQERSNKCCDITLLLGGTLSGSVWCLYGYLLNDTAIYVPSVVGLMVNAGKFAFSFFYNVTSKPQEKVTMANGDANGNVSGDFHKAVYDVRTRKGLKKRN